MCLFSDKNWLELIWASYGEFVVFHLAKNVKSMKSFVQIRGQKLKNIVSRCHYYLQLSELVVMHPWTIVKDFSNVVQWCKKFLEKTQIFVFFKKLKIFENVSQKSLWQSFENEKSETAIFFLFPRSSPWCTSFFRSTHFSWRKLRNKIAFFRLF